MSLGILPSQLKINAEEIKSRPELELLRMLDDKCIELKLDADTFGEKYGMNAITFIQVRSGIRSFKNLSDEVLDLIAKIIAMPKADVYRIAGR